MSTVCNMLCCDKFLVCIAHTPPKFYLECQWNVLTVQLLQNLLFGYHGNQYSYNVYRKWAKVEKHIFRVLAFTTEWKYHYWMRKHVYKCVFDHFSPNYHNCSFIPCNLLAISVFLCVLTVLSSKACNFVNNYPILT